MGLRTRTEPGLIVGRNQVRRDDRVVSIAGCGDPPAPRKEAALTTGSAAGHQPRRPRQRDSQCLVQPDPVGFLCAEPGR